MKNNAFFDFLSDDLKEKAIHLQPLGVDDFAWRYSDIINVLELLLLNKYILLGGDVICFSKRNFFYTYDNWYYNFDITKSIHENIDKSNIIANDYIKAYYSRNGDEFIYSLVVKDK